MDSSPLDAVDRAIPYHLQENARKPITDIADSVNVSDNTVRNCIRSLEDADVIEGYQVNVDYDRANVQHYYAFVCTARVSEREQLARQARERPAVVEVLSLMTGTNNVVVVGAGSRKDDMTDLAYQLDEIGLTIEREHLIREHERRPFEGFRLENSV